MDVGPSRGVAVGSSIVTDVPHGGGVDNGGQRRDGNSLYFPLHFAVNLTLLYKKQSALKKFLRPDKTLSFAKPSSPLFPCGPQGPRWTPEMGSGT